MTNDELIQPTECRCEHCRVQCFCNPGALAPGEYSAIMLLKWPEEPPMDDILAFMQEHFVATQGRDLSSSEPAAQLGLAKLPVIVPKTVDGACVFLADDGSCSIHAAKPAGCAFSCSHAPAEQQFEAELAISDAILADWEGDYGQVWKWLTSQGCVDPSTYQQRKADEKQLHKELRERG